MSKFFEQLAPELRSTIVSDRVELADGSSCDLIFFSHASLAISTDDYVIYIDPVSGHAPYVRLPKASLILVTHSHYDHLDLSAIESVSGDHTVIVADRTSAAQIGHDSVAIAPGERLSPLAGVAIKAVAAYNTSPDQLGFHPQERGDCGYVIKFGVSKIYVAGDTEPTPEMLELADSDVDIAFLPANQPYTMTEEQVVEAVRTIRPTIFYPYHYGQVEHQTDLEGIALALNDVCEVRIRPLE